MTLRSTVVGGLAALTIGAAGVLTLASALPPRLRTRLAASPRRNTATSTRA
jgi:hypothetical protein